MQAVLRRANCDSFRFRGASRLAFFRSLGALFACTSTEIETPFLPSRRTAAVRHRPPSRFASTVQTPHKSDSRPARRSHVATTVLRLSLRRQGVERTVRNAGCRAFFSLISSCSSVVVLTRAPCFVLQATSRSCNPAKL